MSKVKISNGLGVVMLLASVFAGWQTLLIVSTLILLFCDVDDKLKKMMVTVITFYIGLTIFSYGWSLFVDAKDAIISSIKTFVATLNCWLDPAKAIDISNFSLNVLTPLSNIIDIADKVVSLLITFAKLSFIVGIISNKGIKDNFVTKKISEYVSKAVNFVNTMDTNN